MRERPRILNLFCLSYLVLAVGFGFEFLGISEKEGISAHNWDFEVWSVIALTLLNGVTGLAAFNLSPSIRTLSPLTLFLSILTQIHLMATRGDEHLLPLFTTTAVVTVFQCVALLRHDLLRRIFFDPEHRWWLIPRRYSAKLPVRIRVIPTSQSAGPDRATIEFHSETYDISKTGAFIELGFDRGILAQARFAKTLRDFFVREGDLSIGLKCLVMLELPDHGKVQYFAHVVRKSAKNGRYPDGFAVRFEQMEFSSQFLALGRYLKSVEQKETLKPNLPITNDETHLDKAA